MGAKREEVIDQSKRWCADEENNGSCIIPEHRFTLNRLTTCCCRFGRRKIYFYIYAGPDRRNCRSAGHWGEWLGSVVCWRGEVCSQMKAQGTAGHFWIFNGCRFGHAVSSCWRTRNYDNHFLGTDAEWSIWRSLSVEINKRALIRMQVTSGNSNINNANYKWNIKHDPSAYNHNPGSKILTELKPTNSFTIVQLTLKNAHTHILKKRTAFMRTNFCVYRLAPFSGRSI